MLTMKKLALMLDREREYDEAGIHIDKAFSVVRYFLGQCRWEIWPENVVRELCEVWFGVDFELIPESRNADEMYGISDFRSVLTGHTAKEMLDWEEEELGE